jgi:hypothetical protein
VSKRPSARRPSRAEFIRSLRGETPPTTVDIEAACWKAGYPTPSRQAIESALTHTGERGRPTERVKCPTCGQRCDTLKLVKYHDGLVPVPASAYKEIGLALRTGKVCSDHAALGQASCDC